MEWVRDDMTIALLGRRGSGKSVLIKQLCFTMRDIPLCLVMTPTKLNRWYNGWVPDPCVFDGFSESLLTKLIARQHRLINDNTKLPERERVDERVLLVLDDCITEREAQNSRALQTLFVTGRHLFISVIFATQHVTSRTFPPIMRNNTDLVFCFAQSSEDALDIVAGQWLSGVGPKRDGVDRINRLTRETRYQTLVINARLASYATHLRDFTQPFLAITDLPKFKMCAQVYWKGHEPLAPPPRKSLWGRVWAWVSAEGSGSQSDDDRKSDSME